MVCSGVCSGVCSIRELEERKLRTPRTVLLGKISADIANPEQVGSIVSYLESCLLTMPPPQGIKEKCSLPVACIVAAEAKVLMWEAGVRSLDAH